MTRGTKRIGLISACAHRLYLYRPELFEMLAAAGYTVTVFGPEPQALGDEWLGPQGIRYRALGLSRRGIDPFAERRALQVIRETAAQAPFCMLYSYGIRFAPLANNAAHALGVPCMNVINGAGSLFISGGLTGSLKRLLILPYIRLSLHRSARVVFQNFDDRAMFLSLRLVREDQCLNVNGSGVNTRRFPEYPLPEARVFGFCSRLNPEKGIGELLLAFENVLKTYPDARLLLAGEMDGIEYTPAAPLLRRLCESGSAEYPGEITDVPAFLSRCRYFVFPSYREGTPRATLEAMSCGRPVITTDVTGCRETVEPGVNGLLVKARDEASLREAMLQFCGETLPIAEMGRASRRIAEERFDVYAVNRVLIEEINRLCE